MTYVLSIYLVAPHAGGGDVIHALITATVVPSRPVFDNGRMTLCVSA